MQNLNFKEDIQLWKGILEGERQALSQLFSKYFTSLLNYGLSLIPEEELIKDSIQELFYTIWETRDRLSDVAHVRSYLYASMRRTVYRQAKIHETWHKRDQSYSEETPEEMMNEEQLMILGEIKEEQNVHLRQALQRLSDRQREVVFLKFYGGLSNEEISWVLGVNRQSVYNYIYRAIIALQETLSHSFTG